MSGHLPLRLSALGYLPPGQTPTRSPAPLDEGPAVSHPPPLLTWVGQRQEYGLVPISKKIDRFD